MPIIFPQPTLITINGVALTEEGRQTLQHDTEQRGTTIELASGTKLRYTKGGQPFYKFTITWELVPKDASVTIDGKGGRDEIRSFGTSIDQVQVYIQFNDNSADDLVRNYFVDTYTETGMMRRVNTLGHRYNISLSLIQSEFWD